MLRPQRISTQPFHQTCKILVRLVWPTREFIIDTNDDFVELVERIGFYGQLEMDQDSNGRPRALLTGKYRSLFHSNGAVRRKNITTFIDHIVHASNARIDGNVKVHRNKK